MSLDKNQSVRKGYLKRIIKRDLNFLEDLSNVNDGVGIFKADTSFSSISDCEDKQSPIIFRSVTPNKLLKSPLQNLSEQNTLILKFLKDLLTTKGKNQTLLYPVHDLITQIFITKPNFPITLYTKLATIISKLSENSPNFQELEPDIQECINNLTQSDDLSELKSSISKINLKVVTVILTQTLKRLLPSKEPVQSLSFAYLVLFSTSDPSIHLPTNNKFSSSTVILSMQKYTLTPSKMIQTCRNLPEFIHSHKISEQCIKYTQKIVSKINPLSLQEIDKSLNLFHLYSFIKLSILYYHNFHLPIKTPIPEPAPCIPQCNTSEDTYSQALDGRFKEFLSTQILPNLVEVSARMELLDKFVEKIKNELRSTVLEMYF